MPLGQIVPIYQREDETQLRQQHWQDPPNNTSLLSLGVLKRN